MKPLAMYTRLEQLPNVGKATAGDLRLLGIATPSELIGRDPYELHRRLCEITGTRHDPCMIDVFIAAVRFMEGAEATPWWHYTAERKIHLQLLADAATEGVRSASPRARRRKGQHGSERHEDCDCIEPEGGLPGHVSRKPDQIGAEEASQIADRIDRRNPGCR